MPTYMDIHEIKGGIAAEEVAKAHASDLAVEGKYGVHYHKFWVNESAGKIFCLCEAPTAEAAMQVHREAHGQVADKIIQVEPEVADLFLGGSEVNTEGAALLPGGGYRVRWGAPADRNPDCAVYRYRRLDLTDAEIGRRGGDGIPTCARPHRSGRLGGSEGP